MSVLLTPPRCLTTTESIPRLAHTRLRRAMSLITMLQAVRGSGCVVDVTNLMVSSFEVTDEAPVGPRRTAVPGDQTMIHVQPLKRSEMQVCRINNCVLLILNFS